MAFSLHTVRPAAGSRRARKRVGRGNASGHGTYSTRGMKGQRARSGGRKGLKKKGMKRIIAALPKFKGFVSKRVRPAAVPLAAVAAMKAGEEVTLRALKRAGLVPASAKGAKVIGIAALSKKLVLKGVAASASAKAAIEKAGGSVSAK